MVCKLSSMVKIAIFLLASSAFSLEVDDIILVHVTDVKPSISEDGKSLILKTGGSTLSNLQYLDDKIFFDKRDFSKPCRTTLHWSLNGVTRTAGFKSKDGTPHYGIPGKYVILEPISALKESLWGGSFDDMYTLGDHTISKDAILAIPEDEPELDFMTKFEFNVVTLSKIPEGSTNEYFRNVVLEILKMLRKPQNIGNGVMLSKSLLQKFFKVELPLAWDKLSAEELANDEECAVFNKVSLSSQLNGVIEIDQEKCFICKINHATSQFEIAFFKEKDKDGTACMKLSQLEKLFSDAGYLFFEFGLIHGVSKIYEYEKQLKDSYTNSIDKNSLVQELRQFVEEKYREIKKTTPPQGFYQVLSRMK